jgi:hypothetical protein
METLGVQVVTHQKISSCKPELLHASLHSSCIRNNLLHLAAVLHRVAAWLPCTIGMTAAAAAAVKWHGQNHLKRTF